MPYTTVLYETRDNVATITMNRPEKLNALSDELQQDMRDAFAEAREDGDVRVIILKANGRAFSAGYELTGGSSHGTTPTELADYIRRRTRGWLEAIWWNPKPIIAQVHGFALAGGGDLAAMCDITISSDDATYGYPVKRMNPRPTINLWPWIIGFKKTKELALTGRMIPAHEALQIGLINQVVPREHLDETVWQTAQVIARSCDKRWQKSYVNAVYERCMGVGAGLQLLVDGWEIDVSGDEIWTEWNRRIREEGLKSALSWRDGRFNEYDSFMRAAPARAATNAE